jgi:ectoine hydroxylase-related dioxygenase (phytanoyl-CoA dioxygenase family)
MIQVSTGYYEFTGSVQPEERAFYDEFGFLVYKNFVSRSAVERISREADVYQRLIRDGAVPEEYVDNVAPTTVDDDGRLAYHHRLNYFAKHSQTVSELASSDRMTAIRTGLGDDEDWLLEDTMNGTVWQLKTGEAKSGYSRIRWHGDFPPGHPLSPAFTAGLYLNESNRFNGCLAVIPGSHRFPVGPIPPEPFYVEAGVGDLVCHHEWLYHGSEAMPRKTDRRATVYFYYCGGAHPGGGLEFASDQDMPSIRSLFVSSTTEETR